MFDRRNQNVYKNKNGSEIYLVLSIFCSLLNLGLASGTINEAKDTKEQNSDLFVWIMFALTVFVTLACDPTHRIAEPRHRFQL